MKRINSIALGMSFLFLGASGCSMSSSKDNPSLYLDLSGIQSANSHHLLGSSTSFLTTTPPPAAVGSFPCYGVNVTGPGIPDTSNHPDPNALAKMLAGLTQTNHFCSYRGVVTPPMGSAFSSGMDATLQVPPGALRLVQIVGVTDATVCQSGVLGNEADNSHDGSRYFEIGRAVVTDLFADRSVGVSVTWPTGTTTLDDLARQNRSLDCGDGNCSSFTQIGVATGTTLQANSVTSSTTYVAQRLTTVPNTYIRRVSVSLRAGGTARTVTAALYSSASTTSPGDITATAPTYASTIDLPPSASASVYTFDLYNPASGYWSMQSGSVYWVVFSTDAASVNSVEFSHAYNSSGSGSGFMTSSDSGATWSPVSATDGMMIDAYGCPSGIPTTDPVP